MAHPGLVRFAPSNWDEPDLAEWIAALERAVASAPTSRFLVAHSLACLLVAHWSQASRTKIDGAFLVSVPDPTAQAFPSKASGFANAPEEPLRFPSLIVASTNDPYGSLAYMRKRAEDWGGELIVAGGLGHINGASGLGDWPEGWEMFRAFVQAQLARSVAI